MREQEKKDPIISQKSRKAVPGVRVFRWLLIGLGILVVLGASFYPLENWRGKRAWQRCQRDLRARGEVLDWAAFIPNPVPDEQNIFKVPKVSEWFVGRDTNEIVELLDAKNLYDSVRRSDLSVKPVVVAEVRVINSDTNLNLWNVDALLQYWHSGTALYTRLNISRTNAVRSADAQINAPSKSSSPSNVIPLIMMEDVSVTEAIKNLAQQAKIKYVLDPKIGEAETPPNLFISWEDVTAQQALADLLANYNLQWIDDPKTGIARITFKDGTAPQMSGFQSLQDHLGELIKNALKPSVTTPQGFELITELADIKPAQIVAVLLSQRPLTAKEILGLFPTNTPIAAPGTSRFHVEATETNSFRVIFDPSLIYTASEFLAWSDQFQSKFDLIREALKRPYARMEGNYQQPFSIPVPNFRSFRLVSQTLAQRAQCYLLRHQPKKALNELMLVRDICRLLEPKPAVRPMTLMATMLYVAITGIYANVVADGLRMHAWSDPQLITIQEQLAAINLPALLAEGLRCERAGDCQTLQSLLAVNAVTNLSNALPGRPSSKPENISERWKGMPRGWFDQNLVTIGRLEQSAIDCLDLAN